MTGQDLINRLKKLSDNDSIGSDGITNDEILELLDDELQIIYNLKRWWFLKKDFQGSIINNKITLPDNYRTIITNIKPNDIGTYSDYGVILSDGSIIKLYFNNPYIKTQVIYAYIENGFIVFNNNLLNGKDINGMIGKIRIIENVPALTAASEVRLPTSTALYPVYQLLVKYNIWVKEDPDYNTKNEWRIEAKRIYNTILNLNEEAK